MLNETLELGRDFILAPATMEHQGIVFDAWCSSQAMESRFRDVPPEVFKVEMRARILRLLELGKACVAIPTRNWCARNGVTYDPAHVWGFCVYDWDRQTECPIVHFVYVKAAKRNRGLGTCMLTQAAGVSVEGRTWWATHMSLHGRRMVRRLRGTFNDFMIESLFARKRPGTGKAYL